MKTIELNWINLMAMTGAMFGAVWIGGTCFPQKIPVHKVPIVAPCQMLFRHITSKDELVMLLLARPECGAQFTRSIRDSLAIETARDLP